MEKPVFWYQGLFLQPQHLQLNDRYNHELMTPYHTYMHPYFFGVENLHYLKNELSNNVISIDQGNVWFNDKTFVQINENAIIEPRYFDESYLEDGKPMTVYIGLRKFIEYGRNVEECSNTEGFTAVNSRFITDVDPEQIKDMYSNGSPAQVKKLTYLLKVFFEYELDYLGDFELVPVMTIERNGEDIIATESYVPPSLTVRSSKKLREYISETYNQLTSRANELESYKVDRGINNAEFGSRDMVFLLSLRSMNKYIPILDHLIKANVHPWNVYGILRQLVGELSTFSEGVNVLGFDATGKNLMPAYDHLNLGDCFKKAFHLIATLLDEITAGPKYIVKLKPAGDYFAADLKEEFFSGRNRFYIAVKSLTDPKEVLENINISLKTGTRKILPVIIQKAIPGVDLTHLKTPPQELPRRTYTTYFQLNSHAEMWAKVKKHKDLAIYWKTAPQDVEIELMIIG